MSLCIALHCRDGNSSSKDRMNMEGSDLWLDSKIVCLRDIPRADQLRRMLPKLQYLLSRDEYAQSVVWLKLLF